MRDTDPPTTRTAVLPLLRRAATLEVAMWRSLFRWVLRRPPEFGPGGEPFSYAGVVKPILGVFIGLSVVELPILDVILRHTVSWQPARVIALTIGIYGLLWMIGLLASLLLHPHVVDDSGLRIRGGTTMDVRVPWHAIAAIHTRYRSLPSSRGVQYDRTDDEVILNLGTASQTSVDIRFHHPTVVALPKGPSEPATELRFYADEPDALAARARPRLAAHLPNSRD
jgi:hypothetical protein